MALERNLRIARGRTKAGKVKYLRHCCKAVPKTEEELFDDEMLRVAGREDAIVEKVKHSGDTDGRPCCIVWMLMQEEDFKAQRNAVEELIIAAGHKVIFLPKYHPELNFIERIWGHFKRWLRSHCEYNMSGLWTNLGKVCSEEITPLSMIRKFARTSWRWMDCYRRGLSLELTTFATKVYHGHRCVPPTMDALVDELQRHKKKTAAVKLEQLLDEEEEENGRTAPPSNRCAYCTS